jgi:Arc/MetJ-type ribon-helix-helix transcriptional regulator
MTVKTTLSFTDRHHNFLMAKVRQGAFATASSAVAAAIEQLIEDEVQRENSLQAISSAISERMEVPRSEFTSGEELFRSAFQRMNLD